MTIIYFVIVLGIIILVHEIGHFIFAKLFGVGVFEFAIGMGPKIFSKKSKKSETVFTIRLIPLGGFCQLAGEDIDDTKKVPADKLLDNKKWIQRFIILIAGSVFNFILAFILLLVIGLAYGSPEVKSYVGGVIKGYPAYESGIEKGDLIVRVNDTKTTYWDDVLMLLELDKTSANKEIEVIKKDGKHQIYNIKPRAEEINETTYYKVGIESVKDKNYGIIPAFKYASQKLVSLTKSMFVMMANLFSGNISVKNLSGPVGIYSIVGDQVKLGFSSVISLIAFLSINIGFINLLPFPPFDGGRALLLIIEGIIRKKIPKRVELILINAGFFLIIGLLVYVTFNDVLRLF